MIIQNLSNNIIILQTLKRRQEDPDAKIAPKSITDLMSIMPDEEFLKRNNELKGLVMQGQIKLFEQLEDCKEWNEALKAAGKKPEPTKPTTPPPSQNNPSRQDFNVVMSRVENSTCISELEDIVDDDKADVRLVRAAYKRLQDMGVGGDKGIPSPELDNLPGGRPSPII